MENNTKVLAKGNVNGNYAKMPAELFDYVQLELITHTDLVVYMKLYDLVNVVKGYAYPSIPQIMIFTGIKSKVTIHRSLKKLVEVGLIEKRRTRWGNNTYLVYMPLVKAELYKRYPDNVEKFKAFEAKYVKTAEHDKERFQQHKLDKQEMSQSEIQAKQIVPKL